MTMTPSDAPLALISVALCTCNGGEHLRAQLASLLAQDDPAFEVVVVDDASSDGTWALLAACEDPRVRPFRNDAALGINANFARAFALCRGELIAPCDHDDIWLPGKLSRLRAAIGSASLVYCDSELIDEAGRSLGVRLSQKLRRYEGDSPLAFGLDNCVSGHALLFRASLLRGALPVPPAFAYYDWWLAALAAARGGVRYLPEVLVRYRQHTRSCTDILLRRGAAPCAAETDIEREAGLLRRLEAIAAVAAPPPTAPLMQMIAALRARQRAWLCPRLLRLAWRHRGELWLQWRLSPLQRARLALRCVWGHRWRTLRGGAPALLTGDGR